MTKTTPSKSMRSKRSKRSTRRNALLAILVGAPLAVLGLAAFAHTPMGRPLLSKMGGSRIGCPVSIANASPERLEAQRVASKSSLRGDSHVAARARPALGWTLGATKKSDVTTWASASGIACTDELAKTALRCKNVHDASAGVVPIRDLFVRFDARGVLVGVDAMHEGTNGGLASKAFAEMRAHIASVAGEASAMRGDATPASLESATYASASAEYRFENYAADVSATNFGEDGIVVREQYRALD